MHDFYRSQRSCGEVMFSQACVKNSVHRGGTWQGGMHDRGGAWQGASVAGGHAWQRDMHGGGHAWQVGHAWQGGDVHGRGACMVGGVYGTHAPDTTRCSQ